MTTDIECDWRCVLGTLTQEGKVYYSLLLSCVCSSVWSFGSRFMNWRYIIARVSEMHVAYHRLVAVVVYLHQRNKQHSTSPTTLRYNSALPSFLTCIIECVCVCRRRGGIADIERDWRCVLGDSYTGRYSVNLLQLLVVMCLFLSMVVWQPFLTCWR
jgi:hypothetical protein